MTKVSIEFEKLSGVITDEMRKGNIKPRYEHINVYKIFDINTDGKFNRKARLVADVHTIEPPSSITY